MALIGQTQSNPSFVDGEFFAIGKEVALLDIDFGADVSTKVGPASAIQTVLESIQTQFNILGHGALHTTGQNMSMMIEGEYGADKYDGTNSEALAAHLEDVIIALGTVDGVNLALATVTAKTFVL
jgi:hypothetical protein